jgi:hypothetical protein
MTKRAATVVDSAAYDIARVDGQVIEQQRPAVAF